MQFFVKLIAVWMCVEQYADGLAAATGSRHELADVFAANAVFNRPEKAALPFTRYS